MKGSLRGSRARLVALRALEAIEGGAWPDRVLPAAEARLSDPRDRRFAHLLVMSTLRWQLAIDPLLVRALDPPLAELTPRARAALRMAMSEVCVLGHPPAIAVSSVVSVLAHAASPRAGGLANAVLRRVFRDGIPSLESRASLPPWLVARWEQGYGEQICQQILQKINHPAKPYLVALGGAQARRRLANELEAQGVPCERSARHPAGLRILGGALPRNPSTVTEGFVVLDEAAALVALLATPSADGLVLDMAAAPGGKACLLAQASREGLVAIELIPSRAHRLARRLANCAFSAPTATILASALAPPFAAESFETVLLDAPCSGTGTLRRRPDKRMRLAESDIARCARTQRRLLRRAACLVAPGGSLIYAVCSLEMAEGRDQIMAFLRAHSEFAIEDPVAWLSVENRDLIHGDPPMLCTAEASGELEGFAAARMRKKGLAP